MRSTLLWKRQRVWILLLVVLLVLANLNHYDAATKTTSTTIVTKRERTTTTVNTDITRVDESKLQTYTPGVYDLIWGGSHHDDDDNDDDEEFPLLTETNDQSTRDKIWFEFMSTGIIRVKRPWLQRHKEKNKYDTIQQQQQQQKENGKDDNKSRNGMSSEGEQEKEEFWSPVVLLVDDATTFHHHHHHHHDELKGGVASLSKATSGDTDASSVIVNERRRTFETQDATEDRDRNVQQQQWQLLCSHFLKSIPLSSLGERKGVVSDISDEECWEIVPDVIRRGIAIVGRNMAKLFVLSMKDSTMRQRGSKGESLLDPEALTSSVPRRMDSRGKIDYSSSKHGMDDEGASVHEKNGWSVLKRKLDGVYKHETWLLKQDEEFLEFPTPPDSADGMPSLQSQTVKTSPGLFTVVAPIPCKKDDVEEEGDAEVASPLSYLYFQHPSMGLVKISSPSSDEFLVMLGEDAPNFLRQLNFKGAQSNVHEKRPAVLSDGGSALMKEVRSVHPARFGLVSMHEIKGERPCHGMDVFYSQTYRVGSIGDASRDGSGVTYSFPTDIHADGVVPNNDLKAFVNDDNVIDRGSHSGHVVHGMAQMDGGAKSSSSHDSSFCSHPDASMVMFMDGWRISLGRPSNSCLNFYFRSWTLDSAGKFVGAMFAAFLLSILTEGLSRVRHAVLTRMSPGWRRRIVIAMIHIPQEFMGYVLMFAAMMYSVEMLVSVVVGLMIGHFVFFEIGRKTRVAANEV